jgi:hypothetical protein
MTPFEGRIGRAAGQLSGSRSSYLFEPPKTPLRLVMIPSPTSFVTDAWTVSRRRRHAFATVSIFGQHTSRAPARRHK